MEYPLIRDWITNLVSDSLKYSKFILEFQKVSFVDLCKLLQLT